MNRLKYIYRTRREMKKACDELSQIHPGCIHYFNALQNCMSEYHGTYFPHPGIHASHFTKCETEYFSKMPHMMEILEETDYNWEARFNWSKNLYEEVNSPFGN